MGFWRRKPEPLNLDEWVDTFFNPQIHSGTRMAEQIRKAASSVTLTANDIFEIYYKVPHALRRNSHWVMSKETREQIEQLPEVGKPVFGDRAYLIGKPIQIDPEAIGVTLVPECTCDLLDVSTYAGPKFIRGFSRGCAIHPPTEYERGILAAEEEERARVEAAKREARERP